MPRYPEIVDTPNFSQFVSPKGRTILSTRSRLAVNRAILLMLLSATLFSSSAEANAFNSTDAQARFDPRSLLQESKQTSIQELTLGVPIERELVGASSDSYRLQLRAGEFLHLVVDQRGIDVVVTLLGPDGKKITDVDSPNGTLGPEPLFFIAQAAGEYHVQVHSFDQKAAPGHYQIKIEELRPATLRDSNRITAERIFAEAEQLRLQGTAESLRNSIVKYNETLPLFRELQDREREATTLNLIGVRYWELGETQKAIDYYKQALPLWRALGNRKEEGLVLHNVGTAYWLSGDSQKALEYYAQALPLIRAANDRSQEAITLNTTGLAYDNLGKLREAINYYDQALVILRALGDRQNEGTTLTSLGYTYFKLGEIPTALGFFNQALSLRRQIKDRRGEASDLNNLGVVYLRLGEPQKALEFHQQALPLRRETGDRNGEVSTLHNIGVAYESLGELEEALKYLEQALSLARSISDKRDEATTLQELGVVYQSLAQLQKSLDYYNQSLQIRRASGDKWAEAITLAHIGDNYLASKKFDEALTYLTQALSLQQGLGDRGYEPVTLLSLARVEEARGNRTIARTHIESALKIIEGTRAEFFSQELRTSYLAANEDSYQFYINLLMRMHHDSPTDSNDITALSVSERARARGLLDILSETLAGIRQGVDDSLLERERSAQQNLSLQSERLSRLLSRHHTPEQEQSTKKEVEAAFEEYQQTEAQIRLKNPRYATLTQPEPLSPTEIEKLLSDNSVLLEYSLGDEKSFLWAVTNISIKSFELPARAEIEKAAKHFYKLITANENRDIRSQVEAASALSQLILAPVASQLGQKRLIIVSDGALQYVPFAALPNPKVGTMQTIDKVVNGPGVNKYEPLIGQHEIVQLPSASVLALLRRERTARTSAEDTVAVFADPVFQSSDPRVRPNKTGGLGPGNESSGSIQVSNLDSELKRSAWESGLQDLQRLPFSRREADFITNLASAGQSLRAVDFDASRATATSDNLTKYRIVHFATHGLLNNIHPELSGIVLSLVDREGKPQNGFLRLHEIYNLKLSADLVVLSGCQTALGKQVKGEGLIGLTRGFMYAGASQVIVSLWEVNDEATAELMKNFYEALLKKKLPPAAALRTAQLAMQKSRWWKAPYYWAGFELQGESR